MNLPIPTISLRSTAVATLLCMGSAFSVVAQEDPATRKPVTEPPAARPAAKGDYTATSRLVGAPVYLLASADQVAEAQRDNETADRPKAKVTEWLINTTDGKLCHAVVSIGGFLGIGDKVVLVPANELKWNNAMERYDLAWTKDQLKAHPSFDLDDAKKKGLDSVCGVTADARDASGRGISDASGRREPANRTDKPVGERPVGERPVGEKPIDPADRSTADASAPKRSMYAASANRVCRASELAALPVYAGAEQWGKTQDLIVDREQNRVVLAVVNHGATLGVGGNDYLVPFRHFALCQKDADEPILCGDDLTSAKLGASVKFEKPKNGVVDPAAAKAALDGTPASKNDPLKGH